MTEWSFRVYDLRTGTFLGDLPVAEWAHTDKLNDSGGWAATLTPSENNAVTRNAVGITIEGRSTVVPFRNGEPLGYTGFIPRGGRRRATGLQIAGGNLLQYLDTVAIESDQVFTGVDQLTMAAALVNLAAAQGAGAVIDTSQVGGSGVPRDQTWRRWEAKSIGEALRQKSALVNGFDFDIRTELDAGTLVRRLRCWYPRRGRPYVSQATPDFTVGGNVYNIPEISGDPDFCTHVVATGAAIASGSDEKYVATATATALIAAGWPVITATLNLSDVSSTAVLQQHADGHIARYGRQATENVALTVDPDDRTWQWGTWDLGDDAQLVIDAGVHPWWPNGLLALCRVIEHRWSWDATNGERLQVVLQGGVEVLNVAPVVVTPPVTPPPVVTPPVVFDPDPIPPDPLVLLPGYVEFPGTNGNYLSVPNSASFGTGVDKTFVWTMSVPDLTPAAAQTVWSHYNTTGNQRGWLVQIETTGAVTFRWSPDGTTILSAAFTSTLTGMGTLVDVFDTFAVTADVDNGAAGYTIRLFTYDRAVAQWFEMESLSAAGTTGFYASSANLNISGLTNGTANPFAGRVRSFQLRDGINADGSPGGELVFAFQSSDIPADTETSFVAQTGETVTVNRTGSPDTLLVPEAAPAAPTVTIPGYFEFPGTTGNYLSVPDAAAFDNTGDKTVVWTMSVPDLTPTSIGSILSHYHVTGNQRGFTLAVTDLGFIRWQWSSDGTSLASPTGGIIDLVSFATMGIAVDQMVTYRLEFDVDNGASGATIRLFTLGTDGITWTQRAIYTTAFTTSIFANTANLLMGGISGGTATPFLGKLQSLALYNGVGTGTAPVFEFTHDEIPPDVATSFVADTGQTVTITRAGSPDLLAVPDSTSGAPTPPAPFPYPFGGIATGYLAPDWPLLTSLVPGGFVRQDYTWKTVQPSNAATFTWTVFDARIAEINANGMKALPMLGYSPAWANGGFSDDKYPPAAGFEDEWQEFCRRFAERYIPLGVRVFELWNEPNITTFWKPAPSVSQYYSRVLVPGATGLRAAATAAGVNITVLSAGTAPASGANQPDDWYAALYALGAKNYLDAVGHHPYTWPYPPNSDEGTAPSSSWSAMQQTRAIYDTMVTYGDAAKKIWCTEVGLPSRDAGPFYPTDVTSRFVTHQLMATRISEIFAEWFTLPTSAQADYAGPLLWYQHRNTAPEPIGDDPERGFGVVYSNGTNKPGSPSPRTALTNAFNTYRNG